MSIWAAMIDVYVVLMTPMTAHLVCPRWDTGAPLRWYLVTS
jgi:hypothetical protein